VRSWSGLAAAFLVFAVLATANAGGYRFGVSDQAYYGVAVLAREHPSLYPRDRPLLDAQSRFMLSDDLLGWVARTLGTDLPPLFLAMYLLTIVALFSTSIALARGLGLTWWAVAAMLILLTLRHRITKTGANTLEGYMHVRMLAFALGVAAMAAVVRTRAAWAVLCLGLAAVLHSTTAVWFALAIALGVAATRPALRRPLLVSTLPAAALLAWALLRGPLAGHLQIMDAAWLDVLGSRDYLFPSAWPWYAWVLNLSYPIILIAIARARRARGAITAGERTLLSGLLGLVGVFLLSVPFSAAHVALAVQLQVTRVFWLTDFFATVYVAWWLMDGLGARATSRARVACLVTLTALSVARGVYVLTVEADRRLVQMSLPAGPWTETMAWLKQQPSNWHVLADPAHAWKYGVSVRLAAERDTLLEIGKDPALATYDRAIAMRVAERSAALAGFDQFTTADVRALHARYGLDVLVIEADRAFDFPVLHRNAGFVVYDLR
jgi:hypothetical protein